MAQAVGSGGALFHERCVLLGHLVQLGDGFTHLADAGGLLARGAGDFANQNLDLAGHSCHALEQVAYLVGHHRNSLDVTHLLGRNKVIPFVSAPRCKTLPVICLAANGRSRSRIATHNNRWIEAEFLQSAMNWGKELEDLL